MVGRWRKRKLAGTLPGRRRGGLGRYRGPGWRAMLTKFETKSARVKGNSGIGLAPFWEPLGRPCRELLPAPGVPERSGVGRAMGRTAPPGLLRASGLPSARRLRCHISVPRQGLAFTPSGRGSSPACTMALSSCGIIGCAPLSTNSMSTTVSVLGGGVETCVWRKTGVQEEEGRLC